MLIITYLIKYENLYESIIKSALEDIKELVFFFLIKEW